MPDLPTHIGKSGIAPRGIAMIMQLSNILADFNRCGQDVSARNRAAAHPKRSLLAGISAIFHKFVRLSVHF